jgi:hypothetical protein
MKHYIIAKYNDRVRDKAALLKEIRELFSEAAGIEGVHGVTVRPCVIDRPNRFDLMIELDMDPSALPAWDSSPVHETWKKKYGELLEKKAIFDGE